MELEGEEVLDSGGLLGKTVVEFVEEEGLLREVFSVLLKKSPIFLLFSHDALLRDKLHYFYMQKLVAMVVLSGHPGPRCIKDYIVVYIVKGTIPELSDTPAAEMSRDDVNQTVIEVIYLLLILILYYMNLNVTTVTILVLSSNRSP